jgi:HAD superfamily hydrolase (TIGR01459 family)
MTRAIDSLVAVAGGFDAIVLDQWGVLHDGTAPYPGAVAALRSLKSAGTRLAVLSNSGKRAAPNAARIIAMGFDADLFDLVMTSGEALWQDIAAGRVKARRLCAVERAPGDSADWGRGLDIEFVDRPDTADAILLMGVPDDAAPDAFRPVFDAALARNLSVLCTNPDRASPRMGGVIVPSPGALAHAHAARGGTVRFYGKPHRAVFHAVAKALDLPPPRLLMVGDSLEHDIAGAHAAGWSSAFVRGGLHAADFGTDVPVFETLAQIAQPDAIPTFTLQHLG